MVNGVVTVALPGCLVCEGQNKAKIIGGVRVRSFDAVGRSNSRAFNIRNGVGEFMHCIDYLLAIFGVARLVEPDQTDLVNGSLRTRSIVHVSAAQASDDDRKNCDEAGEERNRFHDLERRAIENTI